MRRQAMNRAMRWLVPALFLMLGPVQAAYSPDTVATTDNNTTLRNIPSTAAPYVMRLGFAAPGDTGSPLMFKASNAACSLNAGNGDGGSQVKSLDNKCWLAQWEPTGISPMQFGAKGNGSGNDTNAVQAAIDAATNATVLLGPGTYAVDGLTCNHRMQMIGASGGGGFITRAPNQTVLTLAPGCNNSLFRSFWISNAGAASGTGILIAPGTSSITLEHITIGGTCVGLDINGVDHSANRILINGTVGAACYGVRVGHQTNSGQTSDFRLTSSTLAGNQAGPGGTGVLIEDSGGMQVTNTNVIFFNKGTVIKPGGTGVVQQTVWWTFFSNTVLGDTDTSVAFEIDTGRSDAQVKSLMCIGCWMSSSTAGPGLTISNTAGAAVFHGFHFIGARVYQNNLDGVDLNAGTDIDFDTSFVCGNSVAAGHHGIVAAANVTNLRIRGGKIGGFCDGFVTTYNNGIILTGPNTGVLIQGVDLSQGNINTIIYGAGVVARIEGNPGFSLASASGPASASPYTYSAGNTREYVCLTGGTVSNVAVGGTTMATGTNSCVSLSPHQSVVVTHSATPTIAISPQP